MSWGFFRLCLSLRLSPSRIRFRCGSSLTVTQCFPVYACVLWGIYTLLCRRSYPEVGVASYKLLRALEVDVDYPLE